MMFLKPIAACLTLVLLFTGCCSLPKNRLNSVVPIALPDEGLIVQRILLTAGGKEIPFNGYLSFNREKGARFMVMGQMEALLADVLILPDRTVHVIRSSEPLKEVWIRKYLADDLKELLYGETGSRGMISSPEPGRFLVERCWYTLDIRQVDVQGGPLQSELFILETP